ncbi:MAG: undecaprenyl-phosphate glucose phosphotransferase, partial [Ghiorsea sp.]|nr:undecaprenyl-phosphate glucose phosphotransferase [Ghiorsea sp.]
MIKGVMRQYHSWFSFGQRFIDIAVVFVVFMLLCHFYLGEFPKSYQIVVILGMMLTWMSMGALDVYRARRGSSVWQLIHTLLLAWLIVVFALIVLAWAAKQSEDYSRVIIGAWFLITPIVIIFIHIIQRTILRYFRAKGLNTRRVVIIGAGDLAKQLAQRIQNADWMGVELIGFFDDAEKKQGSDILDVPVLGKTKDVYDFVKRKKIDHVYFALP